MRWLEDRFQTLKTELNFRNLFQLKIESFVNQMKGLSLFGSFHYPKKVFQNEAQKRVLKQHAFFFTEKSELYQF